jgi:hypothetical protein
VLGRTALHRVETERRDLLALDQPCVGAVVATDDARHAIAVLRGNVLGEEVGERRRLHHVVVDADEDQIFGSHGAPTLQDAGSFYSA